MRARYGNRSIKLTPEFIQTLEKHLEATCHMMAEQDHDYDKDCWVWGRAHVGDLERQDGIKYLFGSLEDMPEDDLGLFAVVTDD